MKLLWTDIETTGLDPIRDVILEIAVYEADLHAPFDAVPVYNDVLHLGEHTWSMLDPFVREMHTKNGLLLACKSAIRNIIDIELALLARLPVPATRDDKFVLAGSSVHFDHSFIRLHMPTLDERLSHRHYDVSAVSLFAQSLGMQRPPKAEAHRAGADVLESIANAKRVADWFSRRPRVVEGPLLPDLPTV